MILLAALFVLVSAQDPCSNCPLPDVFRGDPQLCRSEINDTSYAPTMIRYSYGSVCYLQLTDCPAYEIFSGVLGTAPPKCIGILPPQRALKCVDGKFRTSGMSLGYPIDRIRCNPSVIITPIPPSDCSNCFTPLPFTSCDSTYSNLTLPYIAVPVVKDGRCYLNFNNSRPRNCAHLSMQLGYAKNFGDFEDKPCYTEQETNPVAVCENNMFQINGRDLVTYQCAEQPAEPNPEDCPSDWNYLWTSDSYFKLGYNKTYNEAKAACIADGGQLASIHSQEENDFIIVMLYMDNKAATIGVGMHVWIGVEVLNGDVENVDGTPVDYSNWSPFSDYQLYVNPDATGCVRLTSTDYQYPNEPGTWDHPDCGDATPAYACRKNKPETVQPKSCRSCIPLTQMPYPVIGAADGNITITYDYSSGCMVPSFTCIGRDQLLGAYLQTANTIFNEVAGGCGQVSHTGRYKCTEEGLWWDEQRGVPLPPYVACTQANPCGIDE